MSRVIRIRRLILVSLLFLPWNMVRAPASEPALPPAAADWMIPKICADAANHPVGVDPFAGCPAGTHLRSLAPGDPLPYRKADQARQQFKDLYPRTAANGMPVVIATFNWHDPRNGDTSRFKLWADGYDMYTAGDGWTSVVETRSGTGEYGTTFLAKGCKPNVGLLFFPLPPPNAKATSGGSTYSSATSQWEEDNQPFPGACPSRFADDGLLTWKFIHDFPFGGVGGEHRPLDTIVSTVGLRTIKDPAIIKRWMDYGHMEVFYFTKLYGVTRWESWIPDQQFDHGGREPAASEQARAAAAAGMCSVGPGMSVKPFVLAETGQPAKRVTMTYQGLPFTMNDCRDWGSIVVEPTPVQPPAWPVSALNVLANFHFNGSSIETLKNWNASHTRNASLHVSATKDDTTRDTPVPLHGVAYLKLDCRSGCPSDAIYQDVPVTAAMRSGTYTMGIIARTEAGSGRLELSLSALDAHGAVISTKAFVAEGLTSEETGCDAKGQHCRTFTFDPDKHVGSVVLSSNFVSQNIPVSIDSRTRTLRFTISPKSANAFDLVSAWLMANP